MIKMTLVPVLSLADRTPRRERQRHYRKMAAKREAHGRTSQPFPIRIGHEDHSDSRITPAIAFRVPVGGAPA